MKSNQWRDYDLAVTRQKLYQSKGKVKLVEPLDPRPQKPKWTGRPCRRKEVTGTLEWKKRRADQTKKYREKYRDKVNDYARNRYRDGKRNLGKTVIPNKRTDKNRKKVKRWWAVKRQKKKKAGPGKRTDKNRKKVKQWYVQRRNGKKTGPDQKQKKGNKRGVKRKKAVKRRSVPKKDSKSKRK